MARHPTECGVTPAARRARLEVADIFSAHVASYLDRHPVTLAQRRVIADVLCCRTAALGGHLDECDSCGHQQLSYNSCRNRHCPKCQGQAQNRWLAQRRERILPVPYFHVVFTLPAALRPLTRANPRRLYGLLFAAAAGTLLAFGRDPQHLGAQLGITCVLHTWARNLTYHPHVHCIVTGGGLSDDGTQWVEKDARFLFPIKALARVFRGKFLGQLGQLFHQGELLLPERCGTLRDVPAFEVFQKQLYQQDWVVYAKRPFGGAAQVYAYLGRYTHRVGLSNRRLLAASNKEVCFRTRGKKSCTVSPHEFIRRFLLHVLPPGLVKIRHYGLLSATGARTRLPLAQRLLEATNRSSHPVGPPPAPPAPAAPPADPKPLSAPPPGDGDRTPPERSRDRPVCPRCERGHLVVRLTLGRGRTGQSVPRSLPRFAPARVDTS